MKTEFELLWNFLLICLYFQVKPTEVTSKHPVKRICHVKKVISYLLHRKGASCRAAGEVLNIDHCTVHKHFMEIQGRIGKNDKLKKDVESLLKLTA